MARADREQVMLVFDMAAEGFTQQQIIDQARVGKHSVWKWLKNPAKYAGHLDEVALERALDGDRSAYENLSLFEREEFMKRALDRSQWTEREMEGKGHVNPYIALLVESLGVTPETVQGWFGIARRANSKAA